MLVPVYWYFYGPQNFLWFCDVALLLTLVALWTESRLLTSMQAVGILLPQSAWVFDFFVQLVTGQVFLDIAGYMFEYQDLFEFFLRALSSFHLWLPFLLVWMVWRLGYDGRALVAQTLLVWVVLPVSLLLPAGPAPPDNPLYSVNINWVFGFGRPPQTFGLLHWQYFAILMVVFPLCLYLPAHFLLRWLFGRPRTSEA